MLVERSVDIGYHRLHDSVYGISLNGCSIKNILENSSLPFYEELIDELDYLEAIFVYSNKYVNLQYCVFENTYFSDMNVENIPFYFYNRGVLINRFGHLVCHLPFALKIVGVANYLGENIKLNVSRNSIIEGFGYLKSEFSNIILKHMKEKTNAPEKQEMLDHLIDYNNTFIDNYEMPFPIA